MTFSLGTPDCDKFVKSHSNVGFALPKSFQCIEWMTNLIKIFTYRMQAIISAQWIVAAS